MRIAILFFLVAMGHENLGAEGFRILSDYSYVDGRADRTGHEINFTSLYKYYQKNQMELGYSMVGKSYASSSMRYDRYGRFGHSLHFSDESYLYANFEKNFSRHYGADWSVYGEPHYFPVDEVDMALGLQFKSYPVHKAWGLRPQLNLEIFDNLLVTLRSDIAIHPERALSGEGALESRLLPRLSLRASGGGGKTDEGDGLLDDFYQVSAKVSVEIVSAMKVNSLVQFYRGDLRRENRYGAGLDLVF